MLGRSTSLEAVLDAQRAWQTSIAAGPRAAEQAAREAWDRCGDSALTWARNLERLGYPAAKVVEPCSLNLDDRLRRMEGTIRAPVPPVVVAFWSLVGGLSVVDLAGYRHGSFWEEHHIRGPQGYCDGLHVYPCTDAWTDFVCQDFEDWEGDEPDAEVPFLISLSPDGYHKDCISGGESYGVHPSDSWTPVWQNFEWSGGRRPVTAPAGAPDFLAYVRTAMLECAGFPGLLGCPGFDEIREQLLEGVSVW
jgi:hypothetical protein